MSWFNQLQQASYRGIRFGVFTDSSRFGRRQVVHEFPFGDVPWVEDLGRQSRSFTIYGFLLEGDFGIDVMSARDALVAAAEDEGTGDLIHPTLGSLNVSMSILQVDESKDHGRMFRITMQFVEAGLRAFPTTLISTGAAGQLSALQALSMAALDFVTKVKSYYNYGEAIIESAQNTVAFWAATVQSVTDDVTNVFDFVSQLPILPGTTFGRYFGGANVGGFGTSPIVSSVATTVDTLIAQGTVAKENVATAITALEAAAAGNDPNAIATAVQNLVDIVNSVCENPSDALRALNTLAQFTVTLYSTTAPIGSSINGMAESLADLIRRCSVVQLAIAAFSYQPSSYNDAINTRTTVCDALETEIDTAGDEGEDDTFLALTQLQSAVALDLTARGASLAPIVTFSSNQTMPAPAWAYKAYQDLDRTDQLISQADPVHPAFMPLQFQALAQ